MSPYIRPALIAAVFMFALSGCASFNFTKPAPAQPQAIAVDFTAAELSGWTDLPIGTYRVPDSQVIISGHQKGGGAGMLFGVIGVAVQHSINKAGGKEAVADAESILRINLTEKGRSTVGDLVATEPFASRFKLASGSGGPVLNVTGAVVLTFVNETDVLPYVVLKANIPDGSKKTKGWTTRYIASSQQPRALGGENGWLADSGSALHAAIASDLRHATEVMLRDVSRPYARNDGAMTTVEGHFPYVKQKLQTTGYTLGEDDSSIYFVPKLGDVIVFAGVNIMPKQLTRHRAFEKGDSVFKVIEDPEKAKKPKKKKKEA